MIAPGCLVILTPLLLGFTFGPKILAGFLPGAIVSGVQMAISAANTGGAWDNAKKYIESGVMIGQDGQRVKKGSDIHKAAVVGDTVGDPLKDTSGPALNILIKLMAILSLIFASKLRQLAAETIYLFVVACTSKVHSDSNSHCCIGRSIILLMRMTCFLMHCLILILYYISNLLSFRRQQSLALIFYISIKMRKSSR